MQAATERPSEGARARRGRWVALVGVALAVVLVALSLRRGDGVPDDAEATATRRMSRALAVLREVAVRRGRVDRRTDPPECGAIGQLVSPITSKIGLLPAKRASCNPAFAGVLVRLLRQAGLRRGDAIAVALSGSFPALNIATIVAAETLGLRPVVISSISSSMFGANSPALTWLDMEAALVAAGLIRTRSAAATLGAKNDNGAGLSAEGIALLEQAIERNDVLLLRGRTLHEAIRARLRLYRSRAGKRGVKAYVNVGGGRASVGSVRTKARFRPGLNRTAPARIDEPGVMSILSESGLPVIHLGQIRRLCEEHGLPYAP